jgi:hypothetical protein
MRWQRDGVDQEWLRPRIDSRGVREVRGPADDAENIDILMADDGGFRIAF